MKAPSVAATGISVGDDNTCQGTDKTLTVVGGTLGDGAGWVWSTDAGFGSTVGAGASIVVDPVTSTTYYVRAEGDCNTTAAVSELVTVKVPSVAATGIAVTNNDSCQGVPRTLSVQGGFLGDGAGWVWSDDAGFGSTVGTGASIVVNPLVTTTYYVRAEGDCNITGSVSQLVTVRQPSSDPTGIDVTDNDSCVGTPKDLTVVGGSLGDGATWVWYTDASFTTNVGTGISITVDPPANTTYYVRAEGDCNNSNAVSVLVTVRVPSVAATGIAVSNDNSCLGTSKTLTVQGGFLGDGAEWNWSTESSFASSAGTGVSIVVDPAGSTTYYVRAEGDCNTTAAVSQLVSVRVPSEPATGIAVTNDNTCQGSTKTLTVQGGFLGDGAGWFWSTDAGFSTSAGTGATIVVDPAVTTTYYVRAEGDCNTTAAVSQVVNVKVPSTDPVGIDVEEDNTCAGTPKTLTVIGGSLGDGAGWVWSTDSLFSATVGTGASIQVDPPDSTIYYVRAEGDCNITGYAGQLVRVRSLSVAPAGFMVTNDNTCQGILKTLTVQGGSLGYGAEWFWYDDPSLTTFIGVGTSIQVDPAETSAFFVRAEGGCNITAEAGQLVTVKERSVAPTGVEVFNDSTCEGVNKTLVVQGGDLGAGAEWQWYSDSIFTLNVGSGSSIQVDPPVTSIYYVRAEGDCNITDGVSAVVEVLAPSTDPAGILVINDNTCNGTPKLLLPDGGSLGDGARWEWYSDPSFTVRLGTGDTLSVDPVLTSTYYLRAEGDCNNTSGVSGVVIVKVPSQPATFIDVTGENTCQGSMKTLSVTGGLLGDGASWFWYADSLIQPVDSGQTIQVDPELTTTYHVRAEGDCNVTDTISRRVVVKSRSLAPDSVLVNNDSTCEGSVKKLYVEGGRLGDGADWFWYENAALTIPAGSGDTLEVDPAVTTIYYVRAEGDCNVSDSLARIVTVLEPSLVPTGIGIVNDSTCPGVQKALLAEGGYLGAGAGWHWYSDSLMTQPAGTGDTLYVDPPFTEVYYLRAEGTCNITEKVSATVNVKLLSIAPDTATVDVPEFCRGEVDSLLLRYEGGTLGTGAVARWYPDTLTALSSIGSGNSLMVGAPDDTTVYFIRFEGDCDTTSWTEVTVTVNPVPEPDITGEMTVCTPAVVSYSASGLEGSQFSWKVTGGTILGSFQGDTVTVEWTGEGMDTITVTETSIGGCLSVTDTAVVKYMTPVTGGIEGPGPVVCRGDTGLSYSVEGMNNSTFEWIIESGTIIRDFGDSVIVDWPQVNGNYLLKVVETSEDGCTGDTVERMINVEGPLLELGEDTYICDGDSFEVLPDGDFTTYLWHDGSTGESFTTGEEGMITLLVTDQYGCTDTDSLYLTVEPLPAVDLGEDTTLCGDVGMVLDAGPDGIIYTWSTGENTREITIFQGERQEYWVEVEDAMGCVSGDTILIKDCDVQFYFRDMPTAITPNNDGANDAWVIRKLTGYSQAEVEIFDRWGTLVWRSEPGYSQPWDGRNMNGNLVPMDSYHFVIRLNTGRKDVVTGIITVIR